MGVNPLAGAIKDQTWRALWEVRNVIDCVPDEMWDREYCGMPCWKHIYHMLHSLDLWFMNPRDKNHTEPPIHEKDLNNLDVVSKRRIDRQEMNQYLEDTDRKIKAYVQGLTDQELTDYPQGCGYDRFTLILAQFRHLHSHMGMIMGFIIDDTGLWPRVLGLEGEFPEGEYSKYV